MVLDGEDNFGYSDDGPYYRGSLDTQHVAFPRKVSSEQRRKSVAQFQRKGFLYVYDAKPEIKSTREKIYQYSASQKGRELTMGSSMGYCTLLVVVALALIVSNVLQADSVDESSLNNFFYVMYSIAIAGIAYLLIMGALGKLSCDVHYKNRGKSNFVRGGLVVLGTGGIIYQSLVVITYIMEDHECRDVQQLIVGILATVFTVLQIALLIVYIKLRINKSLGLTILGRFLIMHIVATNLCVWLSTVVIETVEEIHLVEGESSHSLHSFEEESNGNNTVDCSSQIEVVHILTPYMFPLIIEFSVMGSTMCLALWENCGVGGGGEHDAASLHSTDTASTHDSSNQESSKSEGDSCTDGKNSNSNKPSYYNSNIGFILGWLLMLGSVVVIIATLYIFYSFTNPEQELIDSVVYMSNSMLSLLCIIAIPLTALPMTKLTWKDQEITAIRKELRDHGHQKLALSSRWKGVHKNMDKSLLYNTYLCLFAYKIFCMVAAFSLQNWYIFVDGIVSITMGWIQVIFINWFGFQKRSLTMEHRYEKPGRQGLEFLRIANLALWLINTFLLKNILAKSVQYEAFGTTAWAIMSNVFQPLTILFYFHAMVCVGEVITHAYSCKYVGLKRPTKRSK